MNNLGFGMMRLPVINQDPTAFDYKQLEQMVDAFLHAGFTYFDTSAVYHNGESQTALRRALVERHPRGSYTVATKFPSFFQPAEDKVDEIFAEQLKRWELTMPIITCCTISRLYCMTALMGKAAQ